MSRPRFLLPTPQGVSQPSLAIYHCMSRVVEGMRPKINVWIVRYENFIRILDRRLRELVLPLCLNVRRWERKHD